MFVFGGLKLSNDTRLRFNTLRSSANDHPVGERVALRNAVLGTAVDLGVSGRDSTFGSGRASGLSAVMALSGDFNRDAACEMPLVIP
jgi:hypothetical protein